METQFEDADSFSYGGNKDKVSFRDIILQHLKKIATFSSCEFRGGFWSEKPHPNPAYNLTIKTYIPDTREIYSNAVECMADMLAPYFDKEMKKAEEESQKAMKEAYKKHSVEVKADENSDSTPTKKRIYKDILDRVCYRGERVKINRKLFRALCCFLYRKKYLELGTIED